jgi:xanthine dehydrogenase YagT iron-sulfur-binding subunit
MNFLINGKALTAEIDPRTSLLDLLREHLGLAGSKKGCDQGACGACTVLVDGMMINSCLALAVQYQGRTIPPCAAAADALSTSGMMDRKSADRGRAEMFSPFHR